MRVASRVQARLFGVLGDPVDHSLSPAMQNAAFAAVRLPHLYLRYRVAPPVLEEAFADARRLRMGGLNLTVPLKEAAVPLCDVLTPEARRIGAVNTLLFRGDRLVGHNTDGRGFLRALGHRVRLRGAHAVLIGAGGSARAVGAALVHGGCGRLTVANRTSGRGEHLAARLAALGCPDTRAITLAALAGGDPLADAALVVNTTPLGLGGAGPALRYAARPPPDARRRTHAPPSGGARLRGLDRPAGAAHRHGARAGRCRARLDSAAGGAYRPRSPPSETMSSRLGDLLQRRGDLTAEQLARALDQQREQSGALSTHLVRLGFITEETLLSYLQREYRLPVVDLGSLEVPREVLNVVPQALVMKHHLIPTNLVRSTLTLAMADPSNLMAINEVKFLTGYDVKVAVAAPAALQQAIERYYETGTSYQDVLEQIGNEDVELVRTEDEVDLKDLERATEEAPVVRLVNAVMTDAIRKRASDIHIEPYEKMLRIRFRVDGVLYEIMQPPLRLKNAITSRIKVMANLDIAERRLPQDGRIKMKLSGNKEMDFRVSVLPTMAGEKVVLRLLDKSNLQLDMTKLGFEEQALKNFKDAISKPFGMVLVTGPTGSGKTTTLYSALAELNKVTTNISTAEDPVEFNLVGINQVQMHEEIGLNFAAALRAFLRQDPDVIMVGEIRDFETAEIGIKAALTGHLVLSTLHTNDAPSTVNRLLNMGVEPFLVASSVNIILAQRLARVICAHCKEPNPVGVEVLREMGWTGEPFTPCRGAGCSNCGGTGFKGRIALYEVMPMSDAVREQILAGATALDLKRTAVQEGMKTLRQSGLEKVAEKTSTLEEVLRVTMAD